MHKLIPFLIAFLALQPLGWCGSARTFVPEDRISLGDVNEMEGVGAITVCTAFNFANTTPQTAGEGLVTKWVNGGSGTSWLLWQKGSPNSKLTFRVYNASTSADSGEWTVATGWHRACGVYDGSSVELYVADFDSSLSVVGSGGALTGSVRSTTAAIWIGSYDFGGNETDSDFDGDAAYVQGWGRDLNLVEMEEATRKPCSITNSLEFCLPLWGSNSPEPDLSGNGNTGTVTGATESSDGPPVMFGGGLPS